MKPVCIICSKPYAKRMKFNSGNPKEILLPDCSCEDDILDAETDEWLKRLEARKSSQRSTLK